ncbi:hypothetical protein C3F09_11305 [candidate division GN15 bacterium]|uniref:Uncharacterized protein n=1 Tax=candidate division GN15 bacterium TaxID=2072418 RepID=A0A855WWT3_9BACT|nr:MAG: hypothetical protein C3F09_11305 [candidate division GN15 bacterium]
MTNHALRRFRIGDRFQLARGDFTHFHPRPAIRVHQFLSPLVQMTRAEIEGHRTIVVSQRFFQQTHTLRQKLPSPISTFSGEQRAYIL